MMRPSLTFHAARGGDHRPYLDFLVYDDPKRFRQDFHNDLISVEAPIPVSHAGNKDVWLGGIGRGDESGLPVSGANAKRSL